MATGKKSSTARAKRSSKPTKSTRKSEARPASGRARAESRAGLAPPTEERAARIMGGRGKYVYCIIKATDVQRFGTIGQIGRAHV